MNEKPKRKETNMTKRDRMTMEAMRSRIGYFLQIEEIAAKKAIEILVINDNGTVTVLEEI